MAEKRSKSILGSLKKMLHRDKPSAPAPKKPSGSARKKPAAPAADAPAAQQTAPEAKPEKKVPHQPWYRHRQRW
jgi:hypothetical protein